MHDLHNHKPSYGLPDTTLDHSTALLPLHRFAHLHLHHILSHPPDSVLFPFLHGLEGDNHAQNTFFSSSSSSPAAKQATATPNNKATPTTRVPRYRGLVLVVCEEDLDAEPHRYTRELAVLRRKRDGGFGDMGVGVGMGNGLETPVLEGGSESGGSSEFDDDDDEEDEMEMEEEEMMDGGGGGGMRVDVVPPDAMDIDGDAIRLEIVPGEEEGKHMHPVVPRPAPIQTVNLPASFSSTSTSTSFTCSSDGDSFSFDTSPTAAPTPPTNTDPKTVLTTPPEPNPTTIEPTSAPKPPATNGVLPPTETQTPDLALLTCTFRPSEIVRRVKPRLKLGLGLGMVNGQDKDTPGDDKERKKEEEDEGWEFVPARVPDGISLRNFGIQVPIYATLSDIVVYSPKGPTPNAQALARRLRGAVRRKWEERVERLGGMPDASTNERKTHPELLDYNVFVLDATAADMQADAGVSHIVMRLCNGGVPGAATTTTTGNGYVTVGDMDDTGLDLGMGGMGMDVDPTTTTMKRAKREQNTVDFAQREKEEMRDLTKASEIISVGLSSNSTGTGTSTNSNPTSSTSTGISTPPAHWTPYLGQVFLGNSDDVPLAPDVPPGQSHRQFRAAAGTGVATSSSEAEVDPEDPFNYRPTNDPSRGFGYDICIECHDLAPFPSAAHLRAAEEHLVMLDVLWGRRVQEEDVGVGADKRTEGQNETSPRPRPPPNANAIIHLPFPSSPTNTMTAMNSLMPVIRFLEKWLTPVVPPPSPVPPPPAAAPNHHNNNNNSSGSAAARRWSSVTALMPHFPSLSGSGSSLPTTATTIPTPTPAAARTRSFTSPAPAPVRTSTRTRTRPVKVLLYSADGYTESSVPALCLLMAVKHLTLPEAYLELQVQRRRSFFVYHADLGVLRRVEGRLREDAERARVERERERMEREREREREREKEKERVNLSEREAEAVNGNGKRVAVVQAQGNSNNGWGSVMGNGWRSAPPPRAPLTPPPVPVPTIMGRPTAKSVSFAQPPPPARSPPMVVPSQAHAHNHHHQNNQGQGQGQRFISGTPPAQHTQPVMAVKGRPRANTSPWLPSLIGDHHSWFHDPRFDGSFPSRVLPFLYLGNLNHAANAYMLHALGITHVVSVGECALVPPAHQQVPYHMLSSSSSSSSSSPAFHHHRPGPMPGRGGPGQGSLWYEEREGRIKVLDIKGVCDDGIDTLEPQLEPICDWIDQARAEGGQVLVHCRVGVSRSATVTIAYVMKHLGLPLVDAYLIVRSRRLSVLIQPNMRLLYNLCGWEIKLAKERAGDDEETLRRELARTLSWPYLAKEVHALNEKYLH